MLVRIIAYSIGSIVAILAVGTIFTSDLVDYVDERSVFIFGIVLGLMTALLKPILSALTLPISCLTFGSVRARSECRDVRRRGLADA